MLVAILQDEIEQRQQNVDEKSLNNGTIFVKCYLALLIPTDDEILPSGVLRPLCFEVSKSDFSSLTMPFYDCF